MTIASIIAFAKVAGYAVALASGWYAGHKAQIAALSKAALELGGEAYDLFAAIRKQAGK